MDYMLSCSIFIAAGNARYYCMTKKSGYGYDSEILCNNALFCRRDRAHVDAQKADFLLQVLPMDVQKTCCLGDVAA